MKKKDVIKNRNWEKDRRDRLNKTFDSLAKLLPEFQPNVTFSKIEILQKTIIFVDELQGKIREVLQGQCPFILKSLEELEESLKVLVIRNNELLDLLNKAGIKVPPFTGPKLLKCIVTVKNKEDNCETISTESENNLNKLNSENESKSAIDVPAAADKKLPKGANKKQGKQSSIKSDLCTKKGNKNEKVSKKSKGKRIVEKIVFKKTFGQRENEKTRGKKIALKTSLNEGHQSKGFDISENSSLEVISILEQTAVPTNSKQTESSTDDGVSILALFTQPNGNKGTQILTTTTIAETISSLSSKDVSVGPKESLFTKNDPDISSNTPEIKIVPESKDESKLYNDNDGNAIFEKISVQECKKQAHSESKLMSAPDQHLGQVLSLLKVTKKNDKKSSKAKLSTDDFERKRKLDSKRLNNPDDDFIPEKNLKSSKEVSTGALETIEKTKQINSDPLAALPIGKVPKFSSLEEADDILNESNRIDTVELASETELPNDLLASLEIPPGESSHGSLSPTAAFLLSFPVVSSTTSRPIETDNGHQMSPTVSSILDLDGHNMNAADHQLLENISSLFAAATPKCIPKQLNTPNEFSENDLFHHELKSSSVLKKDQVKTDISTKMYSSKPLEKVLEAPTLNELSSSKISNELNPTIYLNSPSQSMRTVSDKPKDFFESSQTFAEILESLKSSPSKPSSNTFKVTVPRTTSQSYTTKENAIPNFSFSLNTRTTTIGSNVALSSSLPLSISNSAPVCSISHGFYETLSSIRPTAASTQLFNDTLPTSAINTTVNNTTLSYTFPKLSHSHGDTTTSISHSPFKYTVQSTPKKDSTNGELYSSDTLFDSVFLSNQSKPLSTTTITTLANSKNSKTGSYLYTSPAIQYSTPNSYNPFAFEHTVTPTSSAPLPLSLSQNIGIPPFSSLPPISYPQRPHVGYSTASIASCNTFNATLPAFPSIPKTNTSPIVALSKKVAPSFSFDPTFTRVSDSHKDNKVLSHQPYQNDIMLQCPQSHVDISVTAHQKSGKISTKTSDQKNVSESLFNLPQNHSTSIKKKPVNWMTSSFNDTKSTPVSQFMQNPQSRIQPQTPLSFPDDNLPWSPNRLLDSHNFASAPVLPTLHGDLALNTITAESDTFSINQNAHINTKQKISMALNISPNKNYQMNRPMATKGIEVKQNEKQHLSNFSVEQSAPLQFVNAAPSTTIQGNIFSVSQLVDDDKDHRKQRQTSRKLCYPQKPTIPSYQKNLNAQNDDSSRRVLPPPNNSSHDSVQPLQSSTFNDSFSISMLTEPMKPPNQQLSNSYSAEALISGPSILSTSHPSLNTNKRKHSTFLASNSLSQEFYNPADSLMDFSSSNDIFNPYFAHGNLPSSDGGQFSGLVGNYVDSAPQQHAQAQDIHVNYDTTQSTLSQNRPIPGNGHIYSQLPVGQSSIPNYVTPQFSVLSTNSKDTELDMKKQNVYPIPASNVQCESTSSNIFSTPLALSSPLLSVLPAATMPFTPARSIAEHNSSRHQTNFLPNANNNLHYSNRNTSTFNIFDNKKPLQVASQTTHSGYNRNQFPLHHSMHSNNYLVGSNSNALTNFNLSTICPEINHDKNTNWTQ